MPDEAGAAAYVPPWTGDQAQGQVDQPAPADDGKQSKEPKKGAFDAGGQVRLPSGPDEMGKFATWNWVALDLKGRYFLRDKIQLNGTIPLAVHHPDTIGAVGGTGGIEPKMIGGMVVRLDAKIPVIRIQLTAAYMREGAMLLSEKDFPLFTGDFQPGFGAAVPISLKLGSTLRFSLAPALVIQKGSTENQDAIQIPMSLILKVGSLVKLSTDLGVFTGDDISLRAKNGGRIYGGGSLDVKIGPIITHAGAGVASLFTDEMGPYPTMKDSFYIDLNVKYAK